MSKIDDLIAQYCPNGVEFRKLQEIAEIGTGSSNRQDAEIMVNFHSMYALKTLKKYQLTNLMKKL